MIDFKKPFRFEDEMRNCIQDPVFHAEGDVWTHTNMVMGLCNSDVLKTVGLYHDVAKPMTREEVFDHDLNRIRITHRGHSKLGAKIAWVDLWKAGLPLEKRLEVYSTILWHQKVFHLFEDKHKGARIAEFSTFGKWKTLLEFAHADNNGRISPNTNETNEILDLLEIEVREMGCFSNVFQFQSKTHKMQVCRDQKNVSYIPFESFQSKVWMMSGLPGSGKDTYIKKNLADLSVVSLDDIRKELKVKHGDKDQGKVFQLAQERCRQFLRRGDEFVFNATNVTKEIREKWISLFLSYDAFIEVVQLDVPYDVVIKQNNEREEAIPVKAIDNLINKWEPCLNSEAHKINWIS